MIRALLITALAAGVSLGAELAGNVVESGSGKPLARATVTLEFVRSGVALPRATALSDGAGKFAFPGIGPGAYRVRAQRTGFVTGYYGGGHSGSPIVLDADSRYVANILMQRAAAISGEVVDENQVGLPGVGVQAFPAGVYPLEQASSAVTDDRGVFRLAGLAPGRYWVRTVPRELEDHQGILPTFLGQATRAAAARVIAVEAEGEIPAGTLQVMFGRLAHIQGRVSGAAAVSVMLFTDSGKREISPAGDGSFAFDQLAPGTYELLAHGTASLAGWRRVQVGEGATSVGIEMGPMPTVTVRSQPEGRVLASLKRVGDSWLLPSPPAVSGAVLAVLPGEYTVVASPPPGTYVQSVEPAEFALEPGQSVEIAVTLSAKPAKLTGKVTVPGGGAAGAAPVFLYPADPELRRRLGGPRRTFAGENGDFGFGDLPPGTYSVFSALGAGDGVDVDPQQYPAKLVTLEEGQETPVELELVRSR
ncbi:MAG TPA: carboxypeptidase-like regulatory domain-containing protein [Bryobacteraceae bacterium]|nr:carboxypeptidase-like regulatory domain-containing protein [Bryobacteraceae bacterium]